MDLIALPNLHPAMVHLPIALLLAALVLEIAGLVARKPWLNQAAGAVLVLAVLGGVVAVATGLAAEDIVGEAAHETMERHELSALITLGVAVLLLVWRALAGWRLPSGAGRIVYLVVLVVAVGLVGYTGHLGGKLVFRYGVGVEQLQETQSHSHE